MISLLIKIAVIGFIVLMVSVFVMEITSNKIVENIFFAIGILGFIAFCVSGLFVITYLAITDIKTGELTAELTGVKLN